MERILINIISVDNVKSIAKVRIPGWRVYEVISIPLYNIPQEFHNDEYVIAHVNIDVYDAKDLLFSEFEKAPPPADI